MSTIKLQASDNKIFEIEMEVAKCMAKIKDCGDNPVPLPKVDSMVLGKIIEWATYHKDDLPIEEDNRTDNICTWDKDFLKVDQSTLFGIFATADFLGIKPLANTCSKMVAIMIEACESVEEIRQLFNIPQQ